MSEFRVGDWVLLGVRVKNPLLPVFEGFPRASGKAALIRARSLGVNLHASEASRPSVTHMSSHVN